MNNANSQFLQIIDATPLVSIDLIIINADHQILLGKRNNRPARNYWFVPGGSIKKNETLAAAVQRISKQELGFIMDISDGRLLGAYDHIYEDNFAAHPGINTHYVALAYQFKLMFIPDLVPDQQHDAMHWFTRVALLAHPQVHANTKAYFTSPERPVQ